MKKKIRVRRFRIIRIFSSIVAVFIFVFGWFRANLRPRSPGDAGTVVVVIPKGQATTRILARLQDEGVIRSAPAARAYLTITRNSGLLQAGSFRLSPSMSVPEVIKELKHGTLDLWITIPEGWRSEQIVDQLIEKGYFSDTGRNDLYKQFRQHEGELFPDTYLFAKDATADQIIERMTAAFREKTNGFSVTPDQLILASLVEREAKHAADRPLIAGVLSNRLRIGMALQVDATLQYAAAGAARIDSAALWWGTITGADKAIQSPYNTYMYPGLPPGPIANPGLSSINAVLSPADTDYLYYVSENDGTTHYAKTLAGHQENIRMYLR